MRILFTGGSSFTGYWFIKELAAAGHEITATFRSRPAGYEGVGRERVDLAASLCRGVYGCAFGDETFCSVLESAPAWDLLCHHAADATNYRSPEFDVVGAVASNTKGILKTLALLKARGCTAVLLTGSVFERGEGAGSDNLRAFSPYGLSKGLTAEVFRHYVGDAGMRLGKFVIPNPFGPYEEPRFTAYLVSRWYAGQTPAVLTPDYVRDNIHVSLLARCYAEFAARLVASADAFSTFGPSGYVESQGDFARRFAAQMRLRLHLPCELQFAVQTAFPEPRVRTNIHQPDAALLRWNENEAWQALADYYQQANAGPARLG
jgi:nucleoside-diphosphate-sugar epimerase